MLPSEIVRFLENPGGHSLIIRGNAGTGKTTFALQVAQEFNDVQSTYYLSTRVSDTALLNQFPWLEERLVNKGDESKSPRKRSGLGRLKGIGSDQMISPRKEMAISIGRTMADMERLYELVEKGGERVMVIVDSIDALADRYDLSCRDVMIALQRDLVEGQGANLVFVLESNDHMLDYIGDGVVECTRKDHDRRLVREMDLMKLRGCEVQQPFYLFSLKGGKFHCFGADWDHGCGSDRKWVRVEDPSGRLSYGVEDLDTMTGGIVPGSVVLIELGPELPSMISDLLERSLVTNFANAGRGVLWVPLRKESGGNVRASLRNAISDEEMERYVRVVEPASQLDLGAGPFVMPVEGSKVSDDLKWKNLVYSFNRASQPYLSLMGFDSLESIYGGDVLEGLIDHLTAIKKNGGVFIGLTSPTARSTARLADMATIHLKVERIGGTLVLYGNKPFTEIYALTVDERPRGGCISLTPLV